MTAALRLADFDYELPADRVAQSPLPLRDASRLMVLDRATGAVSHRRFTDLPMLLGAGDLLVVNDTRVSPARLRGRRARPGTGGRVEALLVESLPGRGRWRALARGTARRGDRLDFGSGLTATVEERHDDGAITIALETTPGAGTIEEALERAGRMPVPPYIKRDDEDPRDDLDRERYQTVFARSEGALAAPTAGLHFTQSTLESLRDRGVVTASLTLHVGLGTFQPVRAEDPADHRMHAERFRLGAALAGEVSAARDRGGRVVAVGTTVTRALEACAEGAGRVRPVDGWCDLYILPGHRFRVVDALITNFHLPRSTLLMLVAAFAGREAVLAAYAEAVREGYRFYSYGDAMLVA